MIAILANSDEKYLEMQSELRIGLKDYGLNDENVSWLLSYLSSRYTPIYQYPMNLEEVDLGRLSLAMK